MIDRWRVRAAGGQAVKECPGCGQAIVDTGDGIWAHALGVEPCGRKWRSTPEAWLVAVDDWAARFDQFCADLEAKGIDVERIGQLAARVYVGRRDTDAD